MSWCVNPILSRVFVCVCVCHTCEVCETACYPDNRACEYIHMHTCCCFRVMSCEVKSETSRERSTLFSEVKVRTWQAESGPLKLITSEHNPDCLDPRSQQPRELRARAHKLRSDQLVRKNVMTTRKYLCQTPIYTNKPTFYEVKLCEAGRQTNKWT